MLRELVGLRLKKRRNELGLTQTAIAEQLDVEPSTILRWESGKTWPSPEDFERLSVALRLPLRVLFDVEGQAAISRPTPQEALEVLAGALSLRLPAAGKGAEAGILTDHQQELLRLTSGIQDEDFASFLEDITEMLRASGELPASQDLPAAKAKKMRS